MTNLFKHQEVTLQHNCLANVCLQCSLFFLMHRVAMMIPRSIKTRKKKLNKTYLPVNSLSRGSFLLENESNQHKVLTSFIFKSNHELLDYSKCIRNFYKYSFSPNKELHILSI
jgi:hypothetical protein